MCYEMERNAKKLHKRAGGRIEGYAPGLLFVFDNFTGIPLILLQEYGLWLVLPHWHLHNRWREY